MYHVSLTEEQIAELTKRRRASKTRPRVHQRLEMIRLASLGWSIPQIARHLELTKSQVRHSASEPPEEFEAAFRLDADQPVRLA
jgi:DNA-binding NarL/FixJ family response regulator